MKKIFTFILIITFILTILIGCEKKDSIMNTFDIESEEDFASSLSSPITYSSAFASSLGVVDLNATNTIGSTDLYSDAAILVDATSGKVLFQKNVYKKEYPASTTKILTSLVAIENSDITSSREMQSEVIIDAENAVLCDFRVGDVIPFDIVIHGAMMHSGNDAAAALALFASDSLEDFADLMNEKAESIGATESNFVNPHGLHDDNHYTTAYDLYLIFNEAIKNDYFLDILSCETYSNSFIRSTIYGEYVIESNYTNGNLYVNGTKTAPSYIDVIGGKSGYTVIGKRSYVMLAEANDHQYIFVVMKSEDSTEVYSDLDYLLSLIPNNSSK